MSDPTDGWEERPYGWKKKLGPSSQVIRIRPGHYTSMSATPEQQGPYALKGNDVRWEHVEHLGSVDGGDTDGPSLRYMFLPKARGLPEEPREMRFRKGARFYSVLSDENRTGFYHNLINDSATTIELRMEWE
jgi:hypothetical protein